MLKVLAKEQLIDYVAMDIKNCPDRYAETIGLSQMPAEITESAKFLMADIVDYELRTTVVEEFHDEASMEALGQWLQSLGKAKRLFLQPYADRDSVLKAGLHTPDSEKLRRFKAIVAPCADFVEIRGAD
jgi:pyruvate formate lyase activating enzyme